MEFKVLVTGGSGLVGNAIKKIRPDWIFINSKDCDLTNYLAVNHFLEKIKPDIIIHLAANVGGLFKNANNRLEMFNTNLLINYNLLENAYRLGIKRVICCLSTCIFPDGLNRILTENDLHLGEPHHSNYGYAYAKRIMEVQCRLYNENPNFHYQCIIPTNIYGPYDNYHLENAHVIPALIHKTFLYKLDSKKNNKEKFKIMGTGTPLRQFIYSYDLANIIVQLITNNIYEPLLICSTPIKDEINILNLAKLIFQKFGLDPDLVIPSEYDKINDGQQIKTVSSTKLLNLLPDFKFTSIDKGLEESINWFINNYPNIRF